ncbi:MAG: dephospho-CoA kinase [Gammaproteobacteria bacterium]|nr:dephospho-CoA kinase [Gammaproteobacteria bacterium]
MFRVGLTGGIASGKSTISQLFYKLGIPVIDTDIISHQLMQIGQAAYEQTVLHFGQKILSRDGNINRAKLRQIIFSQPQQKLWLEKMIHPQILTTTENRIASLSAGDYVLVVVPLMFETGFNKLVNHVIAIDCPIETQQKRLIQRDKIDSKLAREMISSQLDNQSRLELADSIIVNQDNNNREMDVLKLHKKILNLQQEQP